MRREQSMETNPYAPPKSAVADISAPGLKRRSLILMILFSLVTFGLYYPIWFLRRRNALNRLDSPRKLQQWPFVVAIVWFAFQVLVGVAIGVARGLSGPEVGLPGEASLVFTIIRLAVGVLMLVQAFATKDILEDHFAGPGDQIERPFLTEPVQLSGVMTFIFQIFYLQYAINRYLSESTPSTT